MRELRNTKIIAVDHGYGNMKTANTVTPTGIKAYETEPIFTGNILEYNGIYYRIGEGHKEFIPDKAMDEEYYLLTLMAIARELNVFSIREADVHLAAGLPLTWIRNQRERSLYVLLPVLGFIKKSHSCFAFFDNLGISKPLFTHLHNGYQNAHPKY